MTEYMVRKQIYIPKRQDALLKKLAHRRGISEAQVIRMALEREVESSESLALEKEEALQSIISFARSLRDRLEPQQADTYKWNRQELYDEREKRWAKPSSPEK